MASGDPLQDVGEPVQIEGKPETERVRMICPQTEFRLPLCNIDPKEDEDTKAILGLKYSKFVDQVVSIADQQGVPLTCGRDVRLWHRRPVPVPTHFDLTVVICTDYHPNWQRLIRALRAQYLRSSNATARKLQVELITPIANAQRTHLPLKAKTNARLAREWQSSLLDKISKIPGEMSREKATEEERNFRMRWMSIDCFEVQYELRDQTLYGQPTPTISITVPVEKKWNPRWEEAIRRIRNMLNESQHAGGHRDYESVQIEVVHGAWDFGP